MQAFFSLLLTGAFQNFKVWLEIVFMIHLQALAIMQALAIFFKHWQWRLRHTGFKRHFCRDSRRFYD